MDRGHCHRSWPKGSIVLSWIHGMCWHATVYLIIGLFPLVFFPFWFFFFSHTLCSSIVSSLQCNRCARSRFFSPIVHIRQPHPTNLTILTTTTTTTPTKKQTGLIQSLPCLAWLISSFSPLFWPLPPLLPPPTPANPPCLTNP